VGIEERVDGHAGVYIDVLQTFFCRSSEEKFIQLEQAEMTPHDLLFQLSQMHWRGSL
jgi:hypothetical protein